MFILYVQDNCPFSKKVVRAGAEMGVEFTLRNIKEKECESELLAKGGKRETPYLIDTETNTALYNSDAIISHLISRIV